MDFGGGSVARINVYVMWEGDQDRSSPNPFVCLAQLPARIFEVTAVCGLSGLEQAEREGVTSKDCFSLILSNSNVVAEVILSFYTRRIRYVC